MRFMSFMVMIYRPSTLSNNSPGWHANAAHSLSMTSNVTPLARSW